MKITAKTFANHFIPENEKLACEGKQAGFSVVEMMVSIVIFGIVLGSIYGLLEVGRSGRLNTNMRSEVLQNSRIAINTIGRDIINSGVGYPNIGALVPDNRLAGLFGGVADADAIPDFVTPVYARNNINSVNGTMTDLVSIAFIDNSFNAGVSIPISAITSTGQQLTIQPGNDALGNPWSNVPCQVGDIYLISGQTSTAALGMLTSKTGVNRLNFATGALDPLNINQPGANSAIKLIIDPPTDAVEPTRRGPASIQRVNLVRYYIVDDDGPTNPGHGTLMRDVYGGGGAAGFVTQPLAFGIENFQCQYVMVDGTTVDVPAADQMLNIRQVRISVSVRSPEIDPKTNQPFRQTISVTYSARNLDYEKF